MNLRKRQKMIEEEKRQAEKLGFTNREEYLKWLNKKYYSPLQIYDMLESIPIRGGTIVRKHESLKED